MVISQFLIMEKMDIKKIQQFEPHLGEEEKQQLIEVIDSGWFTEAKKTREFEKKIFGICWKKICSGNY